MRSYITESYLRADLDAYDLLFAGPDVDLDDITDADVVAMFDDADAMEEIGL